MTTPAHVRVLVVDDDRDDALLITDLLHVAKRSKFVVDVAYSAAEAMAALRLAHYDVLLVDYKLPDKSGLDLYTEIQEARYKIPVIIVTSHGDRRLQADAFEAGIAEYLEKGTFTAELLERTCLYAIGLNDRQKNNGEAPGVGVLIDELVSLTRDSVMAQTKAANEMAELRKDLEARLVSLGNKADSHKDAIIEKMGESRLKPVVQWVFKHPMKTLGAILVISLVLALIVVLTRVIDTEAIRAIKDLLGALGLEGFDVFFG